jgi:hypothetical protein
MVCWHHQFAIVHVIRQFISPMAVNVPGIATLIGKVVAISIRHPLLVHCVIFLERSAVHIDNLVTKPDMVARHSNHAFHQKLRGIDGEIKNDDVAAFDFSIRQQVRRSWQSCIMQFVHQQEIAD